MSDISLKSKHPTPGYQDHAALRHLCGALAHGSLTVIVGETRRVSIHEAWPKSRRTTSNMALRPAKRG